MDTRIKNELTNRYLLSFPIKIIFLLIIYFITSKYFLSYVLINFKQTVIISVLLMISNYIKYKLITMRKDQFSILMILKYFAKLIANRNIEYLNINYILILLLNIWVNYYTVTYLFSTLRNHSSTEYSIIELLIFFVISSIYFISSEQSKLIFNNTTKIQNAKTSFLKSIINSKIVLLLLPIKLCFNLFRLSRLNIFLSKYALIIFVHEYLSNYLLSITIHELSRPVFVLSSGLKSIGSLIEIKNLDSKEELVRSNYYSNTKAYIKHYLISEKDINEAKIDKIIQIKKLIEKSIDKFKFGMKEINVVLENKARLLQNGTYITIFESLNETKINYLELIEIIPLNGYSSSSPDDGFLISFGLICIY